ncbi:rwd domain-containing protein [Dipsacomyces acuminosporus]|nr:rwd domain-containing protein [Dipsacomyces acuminosporus]
MADDHYLEEQRSEIEILQSIYPTEFEEIAQDPPKYSITIAVDEDDDIPAASLKLVIEYTATYPDELPDFVIEIEGNDAGKDMALDASDAEDFTAKTRAIGEESMGMAMVFNMAMNLKELATQRLCEKAEMAKKREEERIQKEIEADQQKFIGTPVTRASFLEWKEKFDKEMKETRAKQANETSDERASSAARRAADSKKMGERLTGRQLFEQDKSLAQSDSKFISEGDVSVDASLFENEDLSGESDSEDN